MRTNSRHLLQAIVIGTVVGVLYLFLAIIFPQLSFLFSVARSPYFDFRELWQILSALLTSWYSSHPGVESPLLLLGTVLASLQGSLSALWYFRQKSMLGLGKAGVGFMLGALTASCASCGSFILGSILGLTTSGVVLSYLPYDGLEFGLFGILVLLVTVILTIRRLRTPLAC